MSKSGIFWKNCQQFTIMGEDSKKEETGKNGNKKFLKKGVDTMAKVWYTVSTERGEKEKKLNSL